MTRFCHVLAVVSASLLRCSFAATGEATMRAILSKPMLGDCSINRRRTNTERMTNDAADFWKPPKSFRSDLLTQRDGLFSAPRTNTLKAYLSAQPSSLSAIMISKTQKPCRRQLKPKVCGNQNISRIA